MTGVCACLVVSKRTWMMHAESGRVERVGARRVRGLGMRIVERVVSEQAGVGCGVCVLYSSLLCTGSRVSWVVSHVAEWLSLCSGKEIHKDAVRAAGGVRAPAKPLVSLRPSSSSSFFFAVLERTRGRCC